MRARFTTDGWKTSLDDYLSAAEALFASMVAQGFDPAHPIPVDPDGELLGGAHRLACALALELDQVPVTHEPSKAWAPPWGEAWFRDNGMGIEELERVKRDWEAL